MDVKKLIERLKNYSIKDKALLNLQTVKDAAEALAALQAELEKVKAERDTAVEKLTLAVNQYRMETTGISLCGLRECALPPEEVILLALAALRPVSREQVERMQGEWIDLRECYNDIPKRQCSHCGKVLIGLETPFCEACGAPMTDEAVDIVMERLEEICK